MFGCLSRPLFVFTFILTFIQFTANPSNMASKGIVFVTGASGYGSRFVD